jgi:hypothetical protein
LKVKEERMSDEVETLDAEALIQKMVNWPGGKYVMTQAEASFVWRRQAELMQGNRELQVLALLADQLSHELGKGKRCAVCGRYGDSRCTYDC